ncbi:hypothetical protein [Streptomyces sp. NRRL B-24085]|uniref:hypothetical protein n=2 Tax=Streptomyces sp. NRRL B-24085 TaxID=1709476 RepID=UPI001F267845|nr:hypothetical protein [Streptomyces sp. NRRL B-24085]
MPDPDARTAAADADAPGARAARTRGAARAGLTAGPRAASRGRTRAGGGTRARARTPAGVAAGAGAAAGGGSGAGGETGTGGSAGAGGSGAGGVGVGGSGTGIGVGQGDTLPAGSTLPNCTAGAVRLSVRSLHNAYEPGETPTLLLTATNSSGSDCKVDLGPKNAVLTITQADEDDPYWSSADCPRTAGHLVYRAPAGSSITYTVKWDRKPSAPQCATPPAGSAGASTYLVEVKAPGYATAQASFVLEND